MILLLALLGCDGKSPSPEVDDTGGTTDHPSSDADRDGYAADEDCDDGDADVHPNASEVCNGIDDDCDDTIDEDVQGTWYADTDDDGFGDPANTTTSCDAPSGYVTLGTDCDDDAPDTYPGATEACDGEDDDCDGDVDEGTASPWYADADGDGFGDPATETESCTAPDGYVADDTDCDDAEAATYPDAAELCDGADNDCDGDLDEDTGLDAAWYQDRDEDGFGDDDRTLVACAAPDGYAATPGDCDDLDADVNPEATESCDGVDDDCDGTIDEISPDAGTWYPDADGDGYGDSAGSVTSCTAPSGYVANSADCDDAAAGTNPAATETCDGVDQDCDGTADDGASDASTWYADADGDGYGDPASTASACSAPSGYVSGSTDCDDAVATTHPGATETCNGTDDDCDGTTDESTASDAATWYLDRDADGSGDASTSTVSCSAPANYVAAPDDCDDLDATAYPGAFEYCDGDDDDCDGTVDENAVDRSTWFADADGDLYGDASVSTLGCSAPSGYVADDTDCDDGDSASHPGGVEVCGGGDEDCDGTVDESGAYGETDWYADADSDGYGAGGATTACTAPSGSVATGDDCDDADSAIHPGAVEYCDGTDDDCDGGEDGAVSFVSTAGAWSDLSSTWGAGTAASPATVTLASAGTVYVCDGTYYVNATASAALTVIGFDGSSAAILDGGDSGRTFYTTAGLTLTGVTLTNGNTSGSGGNLYTSSTATLTDVVLSDGTATRGGNLACSNCTLTLSDVTLDGGDATYGGGLYASGATVTGDVVADSNSATYGGGLYSTGTSTLTLSNADVTDNVATTSGGGLYQAGGTTTLTYTTFSGNDGGDYGGGAYLNAGTFTMSSVSNVDSNSADVLGGGFYLGGAATLTCTGSSSTTAGIWGNTALAAGGVYAASTSAQITSTSCDWTASSDNSLYDIVMYLYAFSYGNNASFSCTGYTCS